MDLFDMEQYEEQYEFDTEQYELDLSKSDLPENYMTEEEKLLDDLLNEYCDTIDLIKER